MEDLSQSKADLLSAFPCIRAGIGTVLVWAVVIMIDSLSPERTPVRAERHATPRSGKLSQKNSTSPTDSGFWLLHLPIMGYYEERPPRHGHRTPSELEEDEILSVLCGSLCAMPATFDETGRTTDAECTRATGAAMVPWAESARLRPPKTPLRGRSKP